MSIRSNIEYVNRLKAKAAERSGRKPEDILLVAVSKFHTPQEINEAIDAGITDIGESRVQEIMVKYSGVKPVRWHLIGHLQTNKVKYIIDKVAMIHSVDSLKLAKEIDRRAAARHLTMDILIQINPAGEESKFGVSTEEAGRLIRDVSDHCPSVRIKGLMCVVPYAEDPGDVRKYFAQAKRFYDSYAENPFKNVDFRYLSMGMSHDFEVAIEEGSNLIRVGTAIFGQRDPMKKHYEAGGKIK